MCACLCAYVLHMVSLHVIGCRPLFFAPESDDNQSTLGCLTNTEQRVSEANSDDQLRVAALRGLRWL
jgi:hypothetical protein